MGRRWPRLRPGLTTTTASAGPNHWDAADNWSAGHVPQNGEDVEISNSGVNICWGLAQSAVTLDSLRAPRSFYGKLGLDYKVLATSADGETYDSTAAEYRDCYLQIKVNGSTQGILMNIYRTLRMRGHDPTETVATALRTYLETNQPTASTARLDRYRRPKSSPIFVRACEVGLQGAPSLDRTRPAPPASGRTAHRPSRPACFSNSGAPVQAPVNYDFVRMEQTMPLARQSRG